MRISDPRWLRNLPQRKTGVCLRSCNRFSVLVCEGCGGKCQEVGFERSPGVCVINTKLYYRKGLRFILKLNTFVHLFLCLCIYSFIKYIYIEDFKQHTEIIHWVSKNEWKKRKDEGEVRNKASWADIGEPWQTLELFYISVWTLKKQFRRESQATPWVSRNCTHWKGQDISKEWFWSHLIRWTDGS